MKFDVAFSTVSILEKRSSSTAEVYKYIRIYGDTTSGSYESYTTSGTTINEKYYNRLYTNAGTAIEYDHDYSTIYGCSRIFISGHYTGSVWSYNTLTDYINQDLKTYVDMYPSSPSMTTYTLTMNGYFKNCVIYGLR